jgi:hypothetical protein
MPPVHPCNVGKMHKEKKRTNTENICAYLAPRMRANSPRNAQDFGQKSCAFHLVIQLKKIQNAAALFLEYS